MKLKKPSHAILAAALAAAICAGGCGGSNPDTPSKVVERFTAAYAAENYSAACREMSTYTDIARLGQSLLASYGQSDGAANIDLDHGCAGLLRSAAQADPSYVQQLKRQKVENVNGGAKRATVQTDMASWDVYRYGGKWKLATLDALIPQ